MDKLQTLNSRAHEWKIYCLVKFSHYKEFSNNLHNSIIRFNSDLLRIDVFYLIILVHTIFTGSNAYYGNYFPNFLIRVYCDIFIMRTFLCFHFPLHCLECLL